MSAGQFHWSRNPLGLYRDTRHARVAGVCAGIGNYLDIRPKFIRLAAILACVFGFFVPVVVVYILLAILLKPMQDPLFQSPNEERFWRSVSASPNRTAADLKTRFRGLDRRL